jgi:YbgC/YbaW family acyl-CoA thioester hydrolase
MPGPPQPYIVREYVRWSDVDFAGIIFYGSYVRFFEIAETEMFRSVGLAYHDVFDRYGVWFPRKALHGEFFLPARLDDRLGVAAYVGLVGTTSLRLNFDVLLGAPARLGAAAWQVVVCVDRGTLRPQPIPEGIRAALEAHTLSVDAARAALGVREP